MEQIENILPEFLLNKLRKEYDEENYARILEGYSTRRVVSLRINTLKTTIEKICKELSKNNIEFEGVSWNDTALVIENTEEEDLQKLEIYENR